MSLPPLDVPTLFVVSALVIAFSGCLLIVARGREEGAASVTLWGIAMLIGALGVVLISLSPFVEWPVRAAGVTTILIAVALSWTGARVFAGRRVRPWLVAAGGTAWLAVDIVDHGRLNASGVMATLIGATYILATAAEFWRGRAERLPTRMAAIALLVVHGAVYLIQAAGDLAAPAVFRSTAVFEFLMLEALLHTTGMAFLFMALMKERAELHATLHLRELATRDGLTGLGNRRYFDQRLDDEFRRATKSRSPIGLLMVDVDWFKAFNDTYGHQAGDDCLRSVASVINAAVHRPGDAAMRYGGEEFVVLLSGTDEMGARVVAEDIRTSVEGLAIEHHFGVHRVVTASIGVASRIPAQAGDRPIDLVRAADRALYKAKSAGRNVSWVSGASRGDGPEGE